MIDIQPADLRYFFEVSKTLNISRAAERLNIGQPALSQAIQRLEAVIGARLLDRFKTGVELTAAGRRLLNDGRSAIEIWERLIVRVRATDHEVGGCYSVGCHVSVAIYSLPTILSELLGKYPKLEIKISHGLSREIAEDVISFRTDFGLVINPVKHPDLVIKELCQDRVQFWSTKNCHKDVLICDPALAQSQTLLRKLSRENGFSRFLHSSSLEVAAHLSAGGCGTAILPERIAKLHSTLSAVDLGVSPIQDRLCLIYRADRSMNLAARVITDTIKRANI